MTITTDAISPLSGGPAAIPALNWQVWVNWSDDGIWGAKDVDISDDVLGLRWGWGRRGLPAPEFAAPAALELTLNNADHRYTPGNAGGPLGTNVRPGREVRLRASRLHDDFATSGAGSEDLDKRKTAFGNGSWEVIATAGNGFSVLAGEVRGAAGSPPPSDAVALLDTGDATATLTARYRRATNGQGGFVLRCVAANNCLRLRFDHTASVLERVAGSTVTQLASGSTLAAAAWHDLEIEQTADSVRVHAINLESSDRVGRTLLAASGIADPPDSGRHGLWHSFRNTADRWGGFGVGRGLFRGQVPHHLPRLRGRNLPDCGGRRDAAAGVGTVAPGAVGRADALRQRGRFHPRVVGPRSRRVPPGLGPGPAHRRGAVGLGSVGGAGAAPAATGGARADLHRRARPRPAGRFNPAVGHPGAQ